MPPVCPTGPQMIFFVNVFRRGGRDGKGREGPRTLPHPPFANPGSATGRNVKLISSVSPIVWHTKLDATSMRRCWNSTVLDIDSVVPVLVCGASFHHSLMSSHRRSLDAGSCPALYLHALPDKLPRQVMRCHSDDRQVRGDDAGDDIVDVLSCCYCCC